MFEGGPLSWKYKSRKRYFNELFSEKIDKDYNKKMLGDAVFELNTTLKHQIMKKRMYNSVFNECKILWNTLKEPIFCSVDAESRVNCLVGS